MQFTKDQHRIWQSLFANQINNTRQVACKEWLHGFKLLDLKTNHIPQLKEINNRIAPLTGWKAIRTSIRYSDTLPWYQHLSKKEFIVTNYLRSRSELEFTPEPDIFHDIFGHIPFLTLPKYTEIFAMFSDAFFRANNKQKEDIKLLAWFSYEFGLIKEKGELKIFGAGILSSKGETEKIMTGRTLIKKFTINNVLKRNKEIDNFNKELFVFDSIEALKEELSKFFITFENKPEDSLEGQIIVDAEMDMKQYQK